MSEASKKLDNETEIKEILEARNNENESDDQNKSPLSNANFICSLQAANLMFIDVNINSVGLSALIDSGSTLSFVNKTLAENLNLSVDIEDKRTVIGYGEKTLETLGSVILHLNILGHDITHKFYILSDSSFKYQMILGIDFFRETNALINVAKRTLRLTAKDKSILHVKLDCNNKIVSERHENVSVFAVSDISIDKGSTAFVSIKSSVVNKSNESLENEQYYFEGDHCNGKFDIMCGVIDLNQENGVLVKNLTDKKQKLKEGERLGTLSTLVTAEEDELDEKWNMDKLKEKVKLENPLLSESNKKDVYNMLMNANNALSTGDADIGKARVPSHHIEITDCTPIWQKPRSFSEPINKEIEKQCQELLANDIIEYSDSSWASPCVPVRKSDGSLRLCIDYRKVNNVTKTQSFPMPNITNCLYKANSINYFTNIDLVRGYYQIEIDEESRKYTAFPKQPAHVGPMWVLHGLVG